MRSTAKTRQTIPLWSIQAKAPPLARQPQSRSAAIIPLPGAQARGRKVLTYPAAIAVPPRVPAIPESVERPLSALTLLALLAPTAALGSLMVLHHLLA